MKALATPVIGLMVTTSVFSQDGGVVVVPGGTFRMGTPASAIPELKRRYQLDVPGVFEDEVPDHVVTVGQFRLDRFETTNARFLEFVARHPEWSRAQIPADLHNGHYLEHWVEGAPPEGKRNHPVVYVTWHAAQSFCRWAGGRLPTEAEWEFAVRAGDDREFPWGSASPSARRANHAGSRIDDTRPVGSYPANPLGLYDMAGNVWEFILDEWKPGYSAEPQVDPIAGGPIPADLLSVLGRRVLRGASYGGGEVNLRTRWRDSHEVKNAVAFVGFRCAYPRAH